LRVYADSSFIVSIYLWQRQTPVALARIAAIEQFGQTVFLSELSRLETVNAFHLACFRDAIHERQAAGMTAAFESNIGTGVFRLVPDPASMWAAARQLSGRNAATTGCRSLDILHVAIASALNVELFLTFDQRQRNLAIGAGLNAPDLYS
jgi:predicted nucleic acid-binding protein